MADRVRITVRTKNSARLLTKLKSYSLKGVKITENAVSFTASYTDKDQILDILSRSLYNNFVCEDLTLKTALKTRIFAIAFLTAFFLTAALPSLVIFKVDTVVSGSVSKDVTATLNSIVRTPTLARDVDAKELKNLLLSQSGVSFCEITPLYGKLKIELIGSDAATVEEERTEIKSNFDGEISRILLLSGTVNVKVGDKVKSGDTLISGRVTDERTGRVIATAAKGEVYGFVTEKRSRFYPKTAITLTKSGRSEKVRHLSLFGREIGKTPSYKLYELSEKTLDVGLFFPIRVIEKNFTEILAKTEDIDIAFECEKLKNSAVKSADERIESLISVETRVTETISGYEVELITVTEKLMG